jgi:hypothetical protein
VLPPTTPTTTTPSPSPSIAEAEEALAASGSDCVKACRALGSMDRATGQLCKDVTTPIDGDVCDDAKARLRGARDRVRAACGGCPGGASVDRDAPIPSVP